MPINLSALTAKQAISAIYIGYYDRAADAQGMEFWLGQYNEFLDGAADGNAGMSLEDIATDFSTQYETRSPDFAGYSFFDTPSVASASAFISNVYLNLFDRAPDAAGLAFWTDQLVTGNFAVGEIILKIIEGAQGTDQTKILNKIEVATDWTESAADAGISTPSNPMGESNNGVLSIVDQPAYDSARSVLDGVDETAQSVANAKTATDTFIDGYFNDAPVADDSFVDTNEDAAVVITPDVTDADPGAVLTYTILGQPANGTVVVNANGTFTYTPDADFNGTDSFDYEVTDEWGETATATIEVNVDAVNDAPVAAAAAASLNEDASINGSVSATDVDNDAGDLTFSVQAAGQPANGAVTMNPDGTYTYTPNADFFGTDSFTYTVTDPAGASSTATVTLTVAAVDDAPVAADDSRAVNEGSFILDGQVSADDVDNNNAAITYALTGAEPAGLTLFPDGSYTFDANDAAYDSLDAGDIQIVTATYEATSNGMTDTGTITITVTGTNDAPVATNATASTVEDTVVSGKLVATDVDADDTLTYSLATPALNGDVTVNQDGTFTYEPDPDYNGVDSFTYTVTDSQGATSTATVSIGVTAADDVLTEGVDNIKPGAGDDIILGNEQTLNAGDNVEGGAGDDKVIINTGATTKAGFVFDVETFQVTADDVSGLASFDLSSSSITGNTLINTNSTIDVAFLFANMNPDTDGDGRPQIDVDILNPTNNAGTRVDVRDSDVTGFNDEINLTVTSSDDDDNDSGVIVLDEGLEHLDLFTTGSAPGSTVSIDAIITNPGAEPDAGNNTRGIQTVNIDTAVTLTVGDTDGVQTVNFLGLPVVDTPQTDTPGGSVPTPNPFNAIEGGQDEGTGTTDVGNAAGTGLSGFENSFGSGPAGTFPGLGAPEAPRVTNIDGSSSTGSIELSVLTNPNAVTIDGGSNNDRLEGSSAFGDSISGNGGDDILDGEGGNDTLLGGDGNDFIFGQSGDDSIRGGENNDVIAGGAGDDLLFGDAGNDIIDMGTTTAGTTDGANFVDGGLGDDIIIGDAEQLVGRTDANNSLAGVDQVTGGEGTDSFFILGNSTSAASLNDVQQVENFIFQNGDRGSPVTQTYDLGTTAVPSGDTVITNTYNAGTGGDILFDGSDDDVILNINASPFTRGATFIGSDQNNTFTGGSGDDTFLPDSDFSGAPSGDVINAGGGNDDILVGASQLVTGGGLSIDGDGGTDRIIVQEGHRGSSAIDGNYTSVEQLVVEDTNDSGTADFNLSIDGSFTNGGQTLTVDGRGMDMLEDLGVDARTAAPGTNLNLLGGAGDDFFDMGQNLDGNVSIDGGGDNLFVNLETLGAGGGGIGGSNGDQVQVNFDGITIPDSAFNNVANIPVVKIESDGTPGVGTLTLGSSAVAAGVEIVDASALDAAGHDGSTIDASGFTNNITIIDGDADLNILTDAADTVVLAGGTDNIQTGIDDDQLLISGTDLDDSDSVDMGAGTGDKIVMQDEQGNVTAEIDLDTQFGFETIEFQGDGNVGAGGFENNNHSVTFQDGGVGTYTSVTDVTIDGRNNIDTLDTFTITLEGAGGSNGSPNETGDGTVTSNLALEIFGIAGTDTLVKHNFGQNNQINAQLLGGDDILRARASDVGDMTVDGGSDNGVSLNNISPLGPQGDVFDIIANGAFVDDDAINLSNFETLTSTTAVPGPTMPRLVGTMGAEFNEAGFQVLVGGTGNDDVTINGDFMGDLQVEIDSGGDDRIDASGSTTALRIVSNYGAITAADTILGGTSLNDKIVLYDTNGNGTTDLSGMSGVETIEVNESISGGSTILLGTGTTALNIVHPSLVGNPYDSNEPLSIDGSTYGAAITFTSNSGWAPPNGPALTMTTNAGADSIDSGASNDVLSTQAGNDTVDAGEGDDFVNAGADNDSVDGGTGNDTLEGGTGNDTINGGTGDDLITGGQGEDSLTGDAGADDFRYIEVSDSQGLLNDVITDFQSGTDRIVIEENLLVQAGGGATSVAPVAGINAPSFGQAAGAISSTAGDGVADWVFQALDGGDPATIWIDTNDDGFLTGLDLQIQVPGVTAMQAGDVILVDTIGPDAASINSITTDSATAGDFVTNDDGTDGTAPVIEIGLPGGTDGTGAKVGDVVTIAVTGAGLPALSTVGATAAAVGGLTTFDYTLTAADITAGVINLNLGDGSVGIGDYDETLTVTVTDVGPNLDLDGVDQGDQDSASVSQAIVVDVTAPTIAIAATLEGDNIVNAAEDQDVVISGTTTGVEDGQQVSVSINGGTAITTTVTGNTWSLAPQDLTGIADGVGAISITADVSDLAGNPAVQATKSLDKDTQADININTPIAGDDIVNAAEEGAVDIAGSVANVEDGQTVTITVTDSTSATVVDTILVNDTVGAGLFDTSADTDGTNTLNLSGLADGTLEVKVEVTDVAGNTASNTYNIVKDATAPSIGDIDTVIYSSSGGTTGSGTIVFNGTFDTNDTVDATQISIAANGGAGTALGAGDIDSVTISATQIVVNLSAAGQTTIQGGENMGSTNDPVVNLGAGFLTDTNANASAATNHLHIGLDIKTSDDGLTAIQGNLFSAPDGSQYDDILTADNAVGDSLTGHGGGDTFNIDVAVSADGAVADGGTTDAFITDFDSGEGDLIRFDASDINALDAALAGVFTPSSDGGQVAFRTFEENGNAPNDNTDAVAATTLAGTIIWDAVNDLLRIDVSGDTSFNGFVVNDPNADDVVIDLAGITGDVTASDIGFF